MNKTQSAFHKFRFLILLLSFLAPHSFGTIYFDLEEEPIPVVDLTVVLPMGGQALVSEEVGLAELTQEIINSGTLQKDKQAFNDELAKYGFDYSFSVGNHYAYWRLQFPFKKDLDYTPAIELLKQNWSSPRFLPKDFELSRIKLEAGYRSSLDSDSALMSTAMRNYLNKFYLGGHPAFMDHVMSNAKLESAQAFFKNRFQNISHLWVGAVAPKNSQKLIESLVSSVFQRQGEIRKGIHKQVLISANKPQAKILPEKIFLLIDKPDRAQTMVGMMSLSPETLSEGNELEFFFADYLLFSNGLDSLYASVIRGEKGLAYGASSLMTQYRDFKVFSLGTNPQASRAKEAFETISQLFHQTLEQNENLKIIDDARWTRVLSSFRNLKALESGLPDQRLGQRMGVVTGSQSYQFAVSDPESWSIDRNSVSKLLESHWKQSAVVVAAVGPSKQLLPLVKNHFPNYRVKVIPFREVILSKTYSSPAP